MVKKIYKISVKNADGKYYLLSEARTKAIALKRKKQFLRELGFPTEIKIWKTSR